MTTPTPTVGTIAEAARGLLRDFPRFFETFYPLPLASTLRLPSPLITDLTLVEPESGDPVTTGFTVDYRNGVIKLEDPTAYEAGLLAYGYHVEWFLDTDLEFYAQFTLTEHLAVRPNATVGDLALAEIDAIAMGTVVYSLWSLMTELGLEVDTSSPEGMMIPAHQRFQQVYQMWQVWKQRYDNNCAMLNIGLNRISVTELRRVARLTGRLVPVFESREIDDPTPPLRTFPPIEPKFPEQRDGSEEGMLPADYGITGGGWTSLGTSGV